MDTQEEIKRIEEEYEKINSTITIEDIQNATNAELAEYLKQNLKIQKKLELLKILESEKKEG